MSDVKKTIRLMVDTWLRNSNQATSFAWLGLHDPEIDISAAVKVLQGEGLVEEEVMRVPDGPATWTAYKMSDRFHREILEQVSFYADDVIKRSYALRIKNTQLSPIYTKLSDKEKFKVDSALEAFKGERISFGEVVETLGEFGIEVAA